MFQGQNSISKCNHSNEPLQQCHCMFILFIKNCRLLNSFGSAQRLLEHLRKLSIMFRSPWKIVRNLYKLLRCVWKSQYDKMKMSHIWLKKKLAAIPLNKSCMPVDPEHWSQAYRTTLHTCARLLIDKFCVWELQIFTDFCLQYFQTIKSDMSHPTMTCILYIIQTGD